MDEGGKKVQTSSYKIKSQGDAMYRILKILTPRKKKKKKNFVSMYGDRW